jgi:hypothetical protein
MPIIKKIMFLAIRGNELAKQLNGPNALTIGLMSGQSAN